MNLNPLMQIEPYVIAGTILVFASTYLVLRRMFADRVVGVMEARRVRCESAAARCEEAHTLITEAEAEAATVVEEAAQEAEGRIQVAREQAELEKGRVVREARDRAEALLREGRMTISAEKEREISLLHREAVECVTLACDKIVGPVDPDVVNTTVDRVVARAIQ